MEIQGVLNWINNMDLITKIEEVRIMEMGFWNIARYIEAYTLADHFSFTKQMDNWL